ncbi:hypothetical protein [Leptolyngbya sp. NIES-2104]|uniref:hypothetical protein n=1 Tax=Leptolyngbya sp. NIES-2104 TaxID=1552121 RepID=UPI0006ECA2F5|nr:hypothetical protein [Leptolyngbya sp. NIES-2104]GAP96556.1 hypothetical protein NIES2104_30940 [Leptolyngbya sp. NIES-2104]
MRHSSWIRYGLARLRPLGRPVFWAPSIAILFLVLFAWEFFSRPELATFLGISNPDETLSAEDQAIGADIDSLPLLMNDVKISSKPEAIAPTIKPTTPSNSTAPNPTNRLFSAPTESVTPPPAQTQFGQGVFAAFTSALTTQLGLPQPDSTASASLPANRLQEAIDKLATQDRPVVAQTPIEGTIRLDNPINAAPRSTNSFSALVEGVQPIPPGTAPVISAPLPIAPPLNSPVPTIVPSQSAEVQPSNFGVNQQPAPVVNQQPFTVPRSIPGRAIGGGNFNTFSNP